MYSFETTKDLNAVHAILADEAVYRLMADDFMPDRNAVAFPVPEGPLTYVLARRMGKPVGIVLVLRRNALHCELHVCMLPATWGRCGAFARAFFPWLWAHFPYRRAIGSIPSCNRAALAFAQRAGMRLFGVNPKVFQQNGCLYDEHWYGIDRPSPPCASSSVH